MRPSSNYNQTSRGSSSKKCYHRIQTILLLWTNNSTTAGQSVGDSATFPLPFAGIYTKTENSELVFREKIVLPVRFFWLIRKWMTVSLPEEYCMKENMMRAPLLKAGLVLLVFALLAYLTSASPEGGVLSSVGQIIIGAFHLVQWAVAMAIGLTVCIAFLIGVFLFAVFLVNKETAASMYRTVKKAVCAFCQPICSRFGASGQCKETTPCQVPPVQAINAPDLRCEEEPPAIVSGEVRKVTESQQALSNQISTLIDKIQVLEEKSADFAVASQLNAIASELAVSGKTLATVQAQVTALEGKISGTVQQLQSITPENMLGDLPARLQKLEQLKDEQLPFDPAPLVASIENFQMEVEELKKRKSSGGSAKAKRKAS